MKEKPLESDEFAETLNNDLRSFIINHAAIKMSKIAFAFITCSKEQDSRVEKNCLIPAKSWPVLPL